MWSGPRDRWGHDGDADVEEIGVVKDVSGATALVVVMKQSACDACAAGSACKVTGEGAEIEALNSAQARKGDTVRISFRPYTYFKGSLMVYGIPGLALILGAVIGKEYVAGFLPQIDPEIVSAICGFGLLAAAFIVVKLFMRRIEAGKKFTPIIEEILRP
jgi:sigma-E factor negative regulatory protein RseC